MDNQGGGYATLDIGRTKLGRLRDEGKITFNQPAKQLRQSNARHERPRRNQNRQKSADWQKGYEQMKLIGQYMPERAKQLLALENRREDERFQGMIS